MLKKIIFLALLVVLLAIPVNASVLRYGLIDQDPDPVRAGEVVELKFKVENLWEETRYNVKVEIVPEFPFSLYSESAVREFGRIDGTKKGGDAIYFDYKVLVDHDAVDGEHEIVLVSNDGESITKLDDMFYVDIEKEEIALKPYIVSSNIIVGGNKGSFTVEIANRGGTDVEALELQLLNSYDYRLLSTSDYIYLGDLEADDTESEDFSIYVEKGIKEVKIPVQLKFEVEDKDYIEQYDLVLNLLTYKEAKKVGLVNGNYGSYIVIAIIIIIVAFIIIRRIRKR